MIFVGFWGIATFAGTLIVGLGGYGPAATIVGTFFILRVIAAPFLPETNGKPLPETL